MPRFSSFILALIWSSMCSLAQAVLPAGDYQLTPRRLAESVYVVEGAHADFSNANGCNIINTGFIVAPDGVIVINTGPSRLYGEQLAASIARVTPKPVSHVIHLNLHPDYFLGNQAFGAAQLLATHSTRAGMAREAAAYETNLYRICPDWMKGTEHNLPSPTHALSAGPITLAGRQLVLREYKGHTDSDLVLFDVESGVVFAGGLTFAERLPTVPHAVLPDWQASLAALEQDIPVVLGEKSSLRWLVPSHGPVRADTQAIAQTRAYLSWLDQLLTSSAQRGAELTELLKTPLPAPFNTWAAAQTEFSRQVVKLYPLYEQRSWAK